MTTNHRATTKVTRQFRLVEPTPVYLGHKVRVCVDELNDNGPWFVATVAAMAIGINVHSVTTNLSRLDPRDRTPYSIGGSRRLVNLISEGGFYEFVLGSRKRGAVAFKRWVCSDILPQLRKYGRYEILADEQDNPVDIPDVMVEMVNLTKKLPSGNISETAPRLHIWEYCEILNLDLDQQQRSAFGKIARRLLLTYDLPILKTWRCRISKHWRDLQHGITNVYPLAILDMAHQEYINGRRD